MKKKTASVVAAVVVTPVALELVVVAEAVALAMMVIAVVGALVLALSLEAQAYLDDVDTHAYSLVVMECLPWNTT